MKTPVGVLVLCAWSLTAAAQQAGTGTATITQPIAGDCSLVIVLPSSLSPEAVTIALDDPDAVLYVVITQRAPLVVSLGEPLYEGSIVMALAAGRTIATARVTKSNRADVPLTCGAPTAPPLPRGDLRPDFEASGYLGSAFDNFAPNTAGGYKNLEANDGTKARWIGGVEAQYRLIGKAGGRYQFWLATQTLHGVRTADVDCKQNKAVAVCSDVTISSDKFLYILEHASTMEAHIDARFEFPTQHVDAETPFRPYAVARFGFLDLEGAPKVLGSDGIGVGILTPTGPFRNSLAQILWGHSAQFQSNPGWNRLKINGVLVFDLAPNLLQRAQNIFTKLGGASRFFIAIAIDRNPNGPGPDAVQSYIGFDFDLRRLFSPFGG